MSAKRKHWEVDWFPYDAKLKVHVMKTRVFSPHMESYQVRYAAEDMLQNFMKSGKHCLPSFDLREVLK